MYATSSGLYSLQITNGSGCSGTAAVWILATPGPSQVITASGPTTFCAPGSVTLSAVTGTGFSYQWRLNGSPILNATGSSRVVNASGNYDCVITSSCGNVTSNVITVTVNPFPGATITPAGPTTFCTGGNVVLNANTGIGFTYQWYNNSVLISGATSQSYTASTTGSYVVVVITANGCTTTSTAVVVTVSPIPTASITAGGPTTWCNSSSVTLNANIGTGLTYQWRQNNSPITGATSSLYVATAAGNYDCIVTNPCSSATSNVITITVNTNPPASITAAGPTTFCAIGSVTLNANTGAGLSYQWQKNSVNISGATDTFYVATTTGTYRCRVTNLCGTTTSNSIVVTVNTSPTASITASGPTTFCSPSSVTLNANTGTGLSYQWRLNGGNISGATASSYIATASGNYDCVVSNSCGSATSNIITVTVNSAPPAVITAAGPTTICYPGSVTLNANTGTGLTYQWRLNTAAIIGATSSSYVAAGPGNYDCIVTNSCGSTTSNTITVTVNAAPPATITAAGPTTFCGPGSVMLNANTGTGLSYQWRLNGIDISGATASSYLATGSRVFMIVWYQTHAELPLPTLSLLLWMYFLTPMLPLPAQQRFALRVLLLLTLAHALHAPTNGGSTQ
jgi:hypothetical protein